MGNVFDDMKKELNHVDETNWGPWKLDRATGKIYIEHTPQISYALSISDLRGSTALFNSLRQVEGKAWANNECLGGLVRAAFAILRSPSDPLHSDTEL